MSFVLSMALRELRASGRRLSFFFLCISIGVGAIVALRSTIESVQRMFANEARVLLGADLMLSSNQGVAPEFEQRIAQRLREAGASSMRSVEVASMVRALDKPSAATRIVELRGVETGFPYYGRLALASGQRFDQALLRDFGALVRPELLSQLELSVGDALQIGTQRFVIRGVIETEPGRRLGMFSLGPRVLVDLADLERTGLFGFGSRASFQRLVKLPRAKLAALAQALRADLSRSFVRVRSSDTTEGEAAENLGRAENYLSLVGLVILILGGIGVASVVGVFVQQKIRSIAILKCVGARSQQLLAIYMLQVLALGALGSLFGVALAGLALRAIPQTLALAATQGIAVAIGLTLPAVGQGVGIGLLVSMLFSLVPLLEVRRVKPSLLLRNAKRPARPDRLQVIAGIALIAALLALAVWQAGSMRVGMTVAVGFVAIALLLHVAGSALIRALGPLSAVRWFPLRHAVLQLSHPGSQMRVVLLAVGLGSFFGIGVRSLQELLIGEFTVDLAADAPDTFLLDIQSDQIEPLRAFLAQQARGTPDLAKLRILPVLRARVTGIEGRQLRLEHYEDVRGRGSLAREYNVTYRAALEANERVVAGRFWDGSASPNAEVSIEESLHERFAIELGDVIRFDVLGRTLAARVTSVRRVNWSDARAGGFMFVFRPGLLEAAPHAYVAFLRGPDDPAARAHLHSALVARYPNLSVIDGRDMLVTIRGVLEKVTAAITGVGALVMASGLLILTGAVAMTKYRRLYEAAIFKTLGATRRVIATMLLLEYGILGALAGTIGSLGATGLSWGISRFALHIAWRPLPLLSLAGIGICASLVALVGVAASWEVLHRRPLSTLRAE